MTLIEFTLAAKKIVDDAGFGPCTVSCASDMRINAEGSIEYQHKATAHVKGEMITSWMEPHPYSCNNPTLALERFQIAVDRKLAAPSEPEAITEIEAPSQDLVVPISKDARKHYQTAVDAIGSKTVIMIEATESNAGMTVEIGPSGDSLDMFITQEQIDGMNTVVSKHAPTEESEATNG